MSSKDLFATAAAIADAGEKIYARSRKELERDHMNKFVAIDTKTANYYVGDTLEAAFAKGLAGSPHAPLHLIRVGHKGVHSHKGFRSLYGFGSSPAPVPA